MSLKPTLRIENLRTQLTDIPGKIFQVLRSDMSYDIELLFGRVFGPGAGHADKKIEIK